MKKRIGLIVPSSNTVIEVDYYRRLPEEYSLHVARMYLYDTTVTGEEEMLDVHFPKALYDLATTEPDVIVFGCTSAGALRGNAYDQELCQMIERVGNSRSISVIHSVQQVLLHENMKRVLVLTPYIDELNQRIAASLRDEGFEVVAIYGLGIDHNHSIGMVEPKTIFDFAMQKANAHRGEYDGLFLSCTNFRAMDVIEDLQEALGVPVITSNQAAYEQTLRVLEDE